MNELMAAISGQSVISAVIWLLIAAVIWGLVNWLVGYIGVGEPFAKIIRVVMAILAVLICVNALLSIAGRPLIAW